MRRLLILAIALLASLPCLGAPAYVHTLLSGGCHNTTAASSLVCTLTASSSAGDDVAVPIALKTTTRTVKTVTSSVSGAFFTQVVGEVPNGSSDLPTLFVCHKCVALASSSTITITLNGTSLIAAAPEEYSGVTSWGTAATLTGSSTTPNASTPINDANNIVLTVIANLGNGGTITANTGSLRDDSCTGSTSSNVCVSIVDNTNATPGTSVTGKTTLGTSVAWSAVAFELRANKASTTDLVGSYGTESAQDISATSENNFQPPLAPELALSGNIAACGIAWPAGTAAPTTFTDDKSDTFTKAIEEDGSNLDMGVWIGAPTAGAHLLSISFGSALATSATMVEHCVDFNNATSTVDATCGQASFGGPNLTCNASTNMTLSTTDIVFVWSILDGGLGATNTDMGPCRPGLGFTLVIPANVAGWCSEFEETGTSFNPAMFFAPFASGAGGTSSPTYMIAGVALKKSAGAGTAPTGAYISREWQASVSSNLVNGNMQCPSNAGFMSGMVSQSGGTYTVKSSDGVSWTNNKPNSQFLYDTNATNLDDSSGCQLSNTDAGNDEIIFRDIHGIATSNPVVTPGACPSPSTLVNSGSNDGCEGTGSAANPSQQLPNITPANSGDLILDTVIAGTGPMTNCTAPTGCIIDIGTYTGQTDSSFWGLGEGHAHWYPTSTSNGNFTYGNPGGTAPTGTAVELKAAVTSAPSIFIDKKLKIERESE